MMTMMMMRLQIKIPVSSVTDIVKMNTAMIIPNAVGIFTASNKVRRIAGALQQLRPLITRVSFLVKFKCIQHVRLLLASPWSRLWASRLQNYCVLSSDVHFSH